jgi:exosortase
LNSAKPGLAVIVLAALVYWVGVRGANARLVATSLVVLIFGLILYVGGWRWATVLWFPCVFLVFMIPLNFMEPYVSFPLRIFVARISTGLLKVLGLDVYQNGTGILSRTGRFAPLDVADPCSGIRSLVALMALTSLYGYMTMDRGWKKWVLFGASIPLAMLGNVARITTVALVAQGFGSDWAMKIYHDYSGYIVFSLAIVSMVILGVMLNLQYREILHRWMHEEVPRPKPPRRRPPRNR